MAQVLVVDDDQPVRDALRMVLEDEGHEVTEVGDGQQALDVLRRSAAPMVVVLDLMMPKYDGTHVLRAVAEEPEALGRHAYVLLTAAGKTLPSAVTALLRDLVVPVVSKPFDIDHLLRVVALAVQRLSGQNPHPQPRP